MTPFLELVKAASTQGYQLQLASHTDEAYLRGLAIAIAKVDQHVFDELSKDAQAWYQVMVEKIKLPFDQWPKLPGFKDEPLRTVQKTPVLRHSGIVSKIRQIVMMDPDLGARQVQKLLDATSIPGIKFEVVSVVVSETKSFIILARELGFWRDKSIYEGQEALPNSIEGESTPSSA